MVVIEVLQYLAAPAGLLGHFAQRPRIEVLIGPADGARPAAAAPAAAGPAAAAPASARPAAATAGPSAARAPWAPASAHPAETAPGPEDVQQAEVGADAEREDRDLGAPGDLAQLPEARAARRVHAIGHDDDRLALRGAGRHPAKRLDDRVVERGSLVRLQ